MRTPFDLDKVALNGFTVMPYGERAVGKTFLIGDMLKEEAKVGPVLYINIAGEDGMLTLNGLGLGNIGVTIDSYDDLITLMTEAQTAHPKYQAWGIDSFYMFAKLAMKKITGSERTPRIPSRDEMKAGAINEWPEMHRLMELAAMKLRPVAKFVMVACTVDKTIDQFDLSQMPRPKFIAPNLPGKEATEANGWFDFVGELKAVPTGPGKFQRSFDMVPNNVSKVRQRLPMMIREPIELPEGPGGWAKIKSTILSHGGLS